QLLVALVATVALPQQLVVQHVAIARERGHGRHLATAAQVQPHEPATVGGPVALELEHALLPRALERDRDRAPFAVHLAFGERGRAHDRRDRARERANDVLAVLHRTLHLRAGTAGEGDGGQRG